ncbi:hypothetical protein [Chryseobacterium viscerum]|uniref:Uncharacterized protein n=1 Tax=Chryseobacterium viscerum TaxID=1037377 RepID=A0A316WQZ9_9FLAO|nr:hypothetical protein [Chryseobacterium viscerum]PWN63842.1 hypothetical protein C1634_004395 [Chryseobacterium viscerum]
MKNLLLALLFLLAGIQVQSQIQKNEAKKGEQKTYSRKNKKPEGKKLLVKSLKNKDMKKTFNHHRKKEDHYDKEYKKNDRDKEKSIVVYERNYSIKYGVYLFMNLDADKNEFSEALALRDI